jgi:hypothetical protein
MNFQASLGTGSTQEQTIINTSSWSTCLAYCEGTGLDITSIQLLPQTNVVVYDSGTNNCYTTNIKSGGVSNSYIVWANDFQSFTTWLNSLTSPVLLSVQNQNKLYVTV